MAKVVISHKVKDYDSWRPLFDADIERRKSTGFTNEQVYRVHDDPNHLYISGDIADLSSLDDMMSDPDLAKKMEEGGVISKPEILVLNPV